MRSLRKAWQAAGGSYNSFLAWSKRYDWYDRAAAWDQAVEAREYSDSLAIMRDPRAEITADLFNDYSLLVLEWRNQMTMLMNGGTVSAKDLKDMITSRNEIDMMGRRAARMPVKYVEREIDDNSMSVKAGPQALDWGETSPHIISLPAESVGHGTSAGTDREVSEDYDTIAASESDEDL